MAAPNGRAGVQLAKREMPDLILCDVMMPQLDGYGVIAALRADPETVAIPFIFLTAKGQKPDIRAGMNLGADEYLTKPVAKPDLLAAIRPRLARAVQQAVPEFKPNFDSAKPLEAVLGLTPRVAAPHEAPPVASQGRQFTERAENKINFNWIRTALQYAAVLLKDVAVLLAILYFLGVVAICVAILFYTFWRFVTL